MRKFVFYLFNLIRLPWFYFNKSYLSLNSRCLSNRIYNSKISAYCFVGPYCIMNNVLIGRYSSIAAGTQIGGMEHSYEWLSTSTFLSDYCSSDKRTIVGNDVWIGANVYIKQGISIGDGAVIGAGSVVTKDVPPYSIYFGNPARFYKNRLTVAQIEKLQKISVFNYSPKEAKVFLSKIGHDLG